MNNGGTASPKSPCYSVCLAVIFFVAIMLRVGIADTSRTIIVGDETTYHFAALNMLKYGTFTREVTGDIFNGKAPVVPTNRLSPGYPLYIAAVYSVAGQSTAAVLASQVTMSILSFWLIYRLLVMLKLAQPATLVTLALVAVYPGFLYNIDRILTETLFLTLLLGFVYAFLSGVRKESTCLIGIAGAVLACAMHVRAQASPLTLLAVFFLVVYEKRGARSITRNLFAFLVPILAIMAPWWIRNLITFHQLTLFSDAGDGARIWGSVPYFIDMGSSYGSVQEVVARNMPPNPAVYYRWRLFGFLQFMWGDVWDEHIVHPIAFLRWMCMIQPLVVVPTLVATPFLIMRKLPTVTFIAAIPLTFTLMNFPFHGLPRYVYPAVPFVFLMTGIIISNIIRTTQNELHNNVIQIKWQRISDKWAHRSFMAVAGVLSILTFYSVYIFAYREHREMSEYRLSRYMNVRISDIDERVPIQSKRYLGSDFTIENTHKVGNTYINDVDGPAVLKIDVPITPHNNKVVSVVTMRMHGGFPFDYTTVYWTGRKTAEITQNSVYRFPTNAFTKSRTVYIDDDIDHLMIVPYIFRGGKFRVDSIKINKYSLSQ